MNKPTLKNCPHCGGEISFRVFADKRRKHTKYVLSVKCEDCKTVTTICTKERDGAAFAALAEKWNARTAAKPPYYAEHVNCRCALKTEEAEPQYIEYGGFKLKRCEKCGGFPAGFDVRTAAIGYRHYRTAVGVVCDCNETPRYCWSESETPEIEGFVMRGLKSTAANIWNGGETS